MQWGDAFTRLSASEIFVTIVFHQRRIAMPKWEIKKIYIQKEMATKGYSTDSATAGRFIYGSAGDLYDKGWAEAEALASDGWELVGITPDIMGNEEWWTGYSTAAGYGCSWTAGLFLVFKRPVA